VEGIKLWATGAMRLAKPPFVSASFLNQLGLADGRTKRFNKFEDLPDKKSFKSANANRWSGRGQFKLRDREENPKWLQGRGDKLDPRDPDPAEHISSRYGEKYLAANRGRERMKKGSPPHLPSRAKSA